MPSALAIGLAAHAPSSGKTTTAIALQDHGFLRLPFAQPVKDMARVLLEQLGIPEPAIDNHLYGDRSALIPHINVSGRHLLQTLGTEWGRQLINPAIWLECWSQRARLSLWAGVSVVADDVRFPEEADLIRSLGGEVWLIDRPGVRYEGSHASEGGLRDYPHFSEILTNDGLIDDLNNRVLELLEAPQRKRLTHGR